MFSNINLADLAERAAWTFVQSFFAMFAVANLTNLAEVKSAALAGAVAGVAAVLSLIKNVIRQNVA